MAAHRFFFIEPSKVGSQHITLLEGYLRALLTSATLQRSFDLVFCASESTAAALSAELRASLQHVRIPVMNPERRRLFRKTLLEFWVVLRYLLRMRRGDVVFVSCVLPSTLVLLEGCNRLLRRRGFFVELHGEIEGLFDRTRQRFSSYGFWVLQWLRMRRHNSPLSLVVIDDFIKQSLIARFPSKLSDADLFVVHIPIIPCPTAGAAANARPAVCFIGYRTSGKGFDQFVQLSRKIPTVEFLAIGGGKIEDVRSQKTSAVSGSDGYLQAIADCVAAVFPYVAGYDYSLSAAAIDALSTGLCVIASERASFVSLQQYFGRDFVAVCRSPGEMAVLLSDRDWLERERVGRVQRLQHLADSKYGLGSVRSAFEQLTAAATRMALSA